MSNLVRSQSWPDVERFYARETERDAGWALMLSIVRYLMRPPFEGTLFATTSMHALCVAQTRAIRWEDQMIRIDSGPGLGFVTFTYFRGARPGPVKPGVIEDPWRTTVPGDEAVARLERILCRRLRWYRIIDGRTTADE